ncbi:uncharacterized protein LOC127841800 isoform X4 [Dreissena polymorpha]|uniref:uncharacterized protein LOC127841800 isoform X4 n=1 Tax=Dreissena polymorpha TaxID=45954 RepID=UPI00226556C1|nr:uncharacterized protein LOC127841800 isoform X4 [Dreissena polymorpha]
MPKLPPPPGRSGGSRPLPPNPSASDDGEAPPPLPSRPAPHRGGKLPPAPPPQNGHSNSDDDEQNYEEPEKDSPPPPVMRGAPPPIPAPEEQETYDELEIMNDHGPPPPPPQPQQELIQDETYDEFDVENELQQDELYDFETETTQRMPSPPLIQDETYEFVPGESAEPDEPAPTPPPLPPSLPSRPALSNYHSHSQERESAPEPAPAKPKTKVPEGVQIGISANDILSGINRLKSAQSNPKPPPKQAESEPATESSVKDRINIFKTAEKAGKPVLPVKPQNVFSRPVETNKASPPPVKKASPPPVKKAPPPAVKKEIPPFVKEPTIPHDDDGDIYDDASSTVTPKDPLHDKEWFHGEISRQDSEKKLKEIGQDGTFLVRKSTQAGGNQSIQSGGSQPYTLVVLFQNHVYNLKVRLRDDGQVALGEFKDDELTFKDVPLLIDHHKRNEVILVNVKEKKQHQTLLKKFPVAIVGVDK